MKIILFIGFLFCFLAQAEDKFDQINASPEASKKMLLNSTYNSSLRIVQQRAVDRFWLSEFSAGFSPIISGSLYSHSASAYLAYQLHLNPHWSVGLKYSQYFHKLNREGKSSVFDNSRIPLLLKNTKKKSYQLQLYWYPLYGKYVFAERVIHFDIYGVVSYVAQELNHLSETVPSLSIGFGMVTWWNKKVNSRLEIDNQYYEYEIQDKKQRLFSTSVNISLGLLF